MINFFNTIFQLEAVVDMILLSKNGNLLYGSSQSSPQIAQKKVVAWKGILASLKKPQTAQFVFNSGLYFICQTEIGYIVIALNDTQKLESIKRDCLKIQAELVNPNACQKILLQLLTEVDDVFKLHVIDELAVFKNRQVAEALLDLLVGYDVFHEDVKNRLLYSICETLGDCSAPEAIQPLESFLENYSLKKENVDIFVEKAAKISIAQLNFELEYSDIEGRQGQIGVESGVIGSVTNDVDVEVLPKRDRRECGSLDTSLHKNKDISTCLLKPEENNTYSGRKIEDEKRITLLLAEGRKEEAVAIIMKYIKLAAKQRMFTKAEKLRDKLIEIDSMMLTEIIHAAEIIEEEKTASIQPEHLKTWKALVEILTQDEFSALYHSMQHVHYKNGEIIVQQGTFLSQLFFVNTGGLQLFTVIDDQEISLKTIGPGEIVESGTFFEASVWTMNVRSLGVELFALPRKQLDKLTEKYPAIEAKLMDFSAQFSLPANTFRKKQRSRRKFKRKSISGRATITLLEKSSNNKSIRFKGDLFDLSRGGLGFCMRASRKKNANKLLGKKVRITIPVKSGKKISKLEFIGIILAVRSHHLISNEYSNHVVFDTPLTQKQFQILTDAMAKGNSSMQDN